MLTYFRRVEIIYFNNEEYLQHQSSLSLPFFNKYLPNQTKTGKLTSLNKSSRGLSGIRQIPINGNDLCPLFPQRIKSRKSSMATGHNPGFQFLVLWTQAFQKTSNPQLRLTNTRLINWNVYGATFRRPRMFSSLKAQVLWTPSLSKTLIWSTTLFVLD